MSTTPNMGMLLPVVSLTPGPLYADENNQAFAVIDVHNHTPGKGVPVPTNGISINADLGFNNFNATLLRSSRFVDQVSPLSLITDVGCLYIAGGNLYYNNQLGQQVQITAGSALNAASIGGIGGDYITSGASVFYTSAISTFTFWQATNTPAMLDIGPLTIRNDTLGSFGISIAPPLTLSANMSLTLFGSLPASTKILTVDNVGQIGAAYDVDNSTIQVISNIIQVPSGGITTTQIANNTIVNGNISPTANIQGSKMLDGSISVAKLFSPMPTGATVGVDGMAISATCTAFATTSNTFVDVTNLEVTITTTGRPVYIGLRVNGATPVASRVNIGAGAAPTYFRFYNVTSNIDYSFYVTATPTDGLSITPNFWTIDTSIIGTPGTYNYKFQMHTNGVINSSVEEIDMIAYEI